TGENAPEKPKGTRETPIGWYNDDGRLRGSETHPYRIPSTERSVFHPASTRRRKAGLYTGGLARDDRESRSVSECAASQPHHSKRRLAMSMGATSFVAALV